MKTTLDIDDDLLDLARRVAAQRNVPLDVVIEEALRAGLPSVEPSPQPRPYRTRPHDMRLRPGFALDNIQDLISRVEGEDHK